MKSELYETIMTGTLATNWKLAQALLEEKRTEDINAYRDIKLRLDVIEKGKTFNIYYIINGQVEFIRNIWARVKYIKPSRYLYVDFNKDLNVREAQLKQVLIEYLDEDGSTTNRLITMEEKNGSN